jgi:hypothetical protein
MNNHLNEYWIATHEVTDIRDRFHFFSDGFLEKLKQQVFLPRRVGKIENGQQDVIHEATDLDLFD